MPYDGPKAYFQSQYNPATNRWHWLILRNDCVRSVVVAKSTMTFPTEHDANLHAKATGRELLRGESLRLKVGAK